MKTTIYFIRHGEVYNPNGIIYARLPNFNLSEKGREQIESSTKYIKDKDIAAIFASPLTRTKESAEIIQKELGIKQVHFTDQIIEVKTSYEGEKFNTIDYLQSEIYLNPLEPTDETIEQLAKRMLQFVNDITREYTGKQIIAVSHGDPIMALKTFIVYNSYDFTLFKTDHYIQHGQIFEITSEQDKLQYKNIFMPAQ